MNPLQEIQFKFDLQSRKKPKFPLGERGQKPFPLLSAHSFRQDIINAIKVSLIKAPSGVYPLNGSVSLIVDVHSREQLLIYGVLKNVMDACIRLLVTDDRQFSSIYIRHLDDAVEESIEIWILIGQTIYSIYSDLAALKVQAVFHVNVPTIPEDRYLPLPRITGQEPLEEYTQTDDILKWILSNSLVAPSVNVNFGWSINIHTKQVYADIDNLGLPLLKNLDGIVHQDLREIKVLHMIRSVSSTSDATVSMKLYSLDDIY